MIEEHEGVRTMKQKKFLKFYGTRPENYDQEIQDWIASTPAEKFRRDLQKYRTAIGVDFYNLNLGSADGVYYNTADEKVLAAFYHKHMGGPITVVSSLPKTEGMPLHIEAGMVVSVLSYAPQPTYKAILDKALAGEEMTEEEIRHIDQGISGGGLYQKYRADKGRYMLRQRVYFGHFGIIKALYEFVYDVSHQRIEVERCALEGCNNIYAVRASGKPGKYCSGACKAKAYRIRKEMAAQTA